MIYIKKDYARIISYIGKIGLKAALAVANTSILALKELCVNMKPGDQLALKGFGKFVMRKTNPRMNARNPLTGETGIMVAAKRKLVFLPYDAVKKDLLKL